MKNPSTFSLFLVLSFSLSFGLISSEDLHAQVSQAAISDLGLSVQWEGNIGGAPPANGRRSVVIWPHSSVKKEHVTVRIGDRIIARINGDEIDNVALEKVVVSGGSSKSSPRLGLAGAEAKAKKLVATYKTLGRSATYESFSQSLTYLVTLASNGILQVMDAETGTVLWQVEAGDAGLPMFGPGVSDEHVAITNGNFLQIYALTSGNLVNTRKLDFSPTGTPRVLPLKTAVPSIDGRAVFYDNGDVKVAPTVLRTGTENRLGTVLSADRHFIAWPMASKLIIAKADNPPSLSSAVTFNETMACLPIASQAGFVGCTMQGTMFLTSTEQLNAIQWKHRLAVQVTKSPLVGNGLAVVVSDDGSMYALNLADGTLAWDFPVQNINEVLAIGKKHVYARGASGTLEAIDCKTGVEVARSSMIVTDVLPNSINDRVLLVNKMGQLSCLREFDSVDPVFVTTPIANPKTKMTPEEDKTDAAPNPDSNLFDGAGEASNDTSSDDPFGTP